MNRGVSNKVQPYLWYNSYSLSQRINREISNIMASHKDTTICGVIESIQQTNNGGFPGKKNTKDK